MKIAVYSVHGHWLFDWRERKIKALFRTKQAAWLTAGVSVKLLQETQTETQMRISRATMIDGNRQMNGWRCQQPEFTQGKFHEWMRVDAGMVLS